MDFSADELRVLFSDLQGKPIERGEWPLPPLEDEDAWSWEVGGRIATLFAANGERRSALAIAVAAPGVVDPLSGRLVDSAGQPAWEGLSIVEALRRHFDAPIACESRTLAALQGERWQGAAQTLDDVLYSLAARRAGRRGGRGRAARARRALRRRCAAGDAELEPGQPISDEELETASGLLADASALLDPDTVLIDGEEHHRSRLIPLLQRVLDEVAPGPRVVPRRLARTRRWSARCAWRRRWLRGGAQAMTQPPPPGLPVCPLARRPNGSTRSSCTRRPWARCSARSPG